MTIEISHMDLIFRGITGICYIIVLILILLEQKKTTQFQKEKLDMLKVEEEDELPQGEWVRMEDVAAVIRPILEEFYGTADADVEYIIQEIEQKAYLIRR